MRFINQSVHLDIDKNLTANQAIAKLSTALGVPYANIKDGPAAIKRIGSAIRLGHHSVLEHAEVTLDCMTNVATYKDFTRHRHAAFTIESTSFVKYNELTLIVTGGVAEYYATHKNEVETIEQVYKDLLSLYGAKVARDMLPQAQAGRMYMTCNIREWRYIIGLRGDPVDNPLTIELRNLMWDALNAWSPILFPKSLDDAESEWLIPQLWKPEHNKYCIGE